MEWSDDGRQKPQNGCTTPVLTCSPQANATSLKTPNSSQKQGNYPSHVNNNNNNANYPSQYDTSLLMSSHPAYNEGPSLQQNHHQRKQQFVSPSSPLSPTLLSPFSPPPFSSGELHHGDQSFPSTPPAYQSPEKRTPVANGTQQQKRTTNGTSEETKLKSNSDASEVMTLMTSSVATTTTTPSSSTATTKTTTNNPMPTTGVEAKMCAACDRSISDRYLLFTADRYWHLDCLRCSSCNVALAEVGSTCFSRSGMTLCRSDYIRMFGSTGICASCRQTIPANDYVMKTSQGSVYHVTCFCCVRCHRTLVPGDKYGLFHGNLLCENDYWVAMTTGQSNAPYNDIQPPTSQQQQQQQQHHHLPHPHHHQQQQQFRGQPMMNGKGHHEEHQHHHHPRHHHHPHHPSLPQHHHHHQQQQQPTPSQQQQQQQQQNQHQQHLNQMRFSHKVG